MNKKLLVIVIVLSLLVSAVALTACKEEHTCVYDQKVVSNEYLKSEADCSSPAIYYYSCECGNKGSETFTDGEFADHQCATEWSHDSENHWHQATCAHTDQKADVAKHNLVVSEDGLKKACECGYSIDCIVDVDVLLEAEDAILNSKNLSIDKDAHGGAYGLAFDNCGQGMYYRYYAYEAGERDVDIYYATGNDYAYMNLYVNGTDKVRVDYPDVEGWFGDYKVISKVTVKINVQQGWNELYLIKDGTADDDYGGYCQVDYIVIHGTGKDYTGQEFNKTIYSYKLEAELGNYHYNGSTVPAPWGEKFSLGYGLGGMDVDGDGVKITYVARSTGTYNLKLAFGQGNDVTVDIYVNDKLINEGKPLTNGSTAWDDIKLDQSGLTIDLVEGEEFSIDIRRNGTWYVLDYILLELVEE